MADNETLELMEQAIDVACKKSLNELTDNNIKTKTANVIVYDKDTFATTICFIDDKNKNEYTLYNKSGEILSEGDVVKVYYTTNVAKGWIGTRMGEPVYPETESGGTEVVITTNQAKHMMKNYTVIRVADGDTHCYGDAGNNIIVSGMEIPFLDLNNLSSLSEIPDSLFRYNISGLWGTNTTGVAQHEIYIRCGEIAQLANYDIRFTYHPYIDGVVNTGVSYTTYGNKPVIMGVLPCYQSINAIYDGENYGYVNVNLLYRIRLSNGNIQTSRYTGINSQYGALTRLGFVSAEERDAAMAILGFQGSAE